MSLNDLDVKHNVRVSEGGLIFTAAVKYYVQLTSYT